MWGSGGLGIGGLSALPYLCFGAAGLVGAIPLAIWAIRLLNRTLLDPDWKPEGTDRTDSTRDTKL
jgi:hypothetical protein